MMMKKSKGFTLMELIVVVAIIAVIGAIAYPNYNSYMKKTRRADAKVGLAKVADRQERYYIQNNRYTTTASDLGLGGAATYTTDEGYYLVTITSAGVTAGWTATADAQGVQAGDNDTSAGDCTTMTLDSTGLRTPAACW